MMLGNDEQQQPSQRRRSSKAGGQRSGHSNGHEAAGLPGSPEAGEPGAQQQHQQHQQHRTPRAGTDSLHVMHGVKSGAWGLQSQTVRGASGCGEFEE